jgi:hypothetical protein
MFFAEDYGLYEFNTTRKCVDLSQITSFSRFGDNSRLRCKLCDVKQRVGSRKLRARKAWESLTLLSDSQVLYKHRCNIMIRTSGKNKSFTSVCNDTDCMENNTSNNSCILVCLFFAAITFLPGRFLAAIRGYT